MADHPYVGVTLVSRLRIDQITVVANDPIRVAAEEALRVVLRVVPPDPGPLPPGLQIRLDVHGPD